MLLASDKTTAIIGLGLTGFSIARYFVARNRSFVAFDEALSIDAKAKFEAEFPAATLVVGPLAEQDFSGFDTIALSPGVPLSTPSLMAAKQAGVRFENDITLFMAANAQLPQPAKVVAVTGSNGKSTVVSWLHHVLNGSGCVTALAGNIGVSPLVFLDTEDAFPEVIVLELSSFQLEIIEKLAADVACILNLSADHMDRYDSMLAYHSAKQRIYRSAGFCVSNKDETLTAPLLAAATSSVTFSSKAPDLKQWGLAHREGELQLCFGAKVLLPISALPLPGEHNAMNALAVLALASALGFDNDQLVEHLLSFKGLPHRVQIVATRNDVLYINDSKATNVGACLAAINGLKAKGKIVLLAGGIAKGADLSPLANIAMHLRAVVVFGEAATDLMDIFKGTPCHIETSMASAVTKAAEVAIAGDIVLLSPACASFDMFKNYADRGQAFVTSVQSLQEVIHG